MIALGIKVLQLLASRSDSSLSATQPSLDFSKPDNAGYRGFYF